MFKKLFEQAEIARYNPEERREYEASLKNFWDYYSTITSALNKGRAEGRAEGREEGRSEERRDNARRMKDKGFSTSDIAEITGLTTEEIAKL